MQVIAIQYKKKSCHLSGVRCKLHFFVYTWKALEKRKCSTPNMSNLESDIYLRSINFISKNVLWLSKIAYDDFGISTFSLISTKSDWFLEVIQKPSPLLFQRSFAWFTMVTSLIVFYMSTVQSSGADPVTLPGAALETMLSLIN